ncbi:hypothetical protein HPP92_014793 [Vanilla planifolia]|uniref:Uncharacterized protein n=1 Tax=Vanilla planifolia TaxID=51239 RepID=A0A835QIY6_VANPL|nr:hypothetical protein HPP92_015321 [Vanilla planifolia]KAG0475107.1 hypothetical protein HPP92_014793 [Vanilla planifolia]
MTRPPRSDLSDPWSIMLVSPLMVSSPTSAQRLLTAVPSRVARGYLRSVRLTS